MTNDTGIEKIDLDKVDWRGSREFFESLGEALDKLDDKDESYDFTWVGKRKSIIEAGAPINKTFRPDVENSKNWDTTENLFIEGDNLDALKLLQESYLGKVKMIYIDPPYNTGKDFVYHDDFRKTKTQQDIESGDVDDSTGIRLVRNDKSNGRYHSDWLSMMYPRLKLARNLMSDDGVIFISIDDNEQPNLKKLCDEIFGEDNFINQIVLENDSRARPYGSVATTHEYIIAYSRSRDFIYEELSNDSKEFKFSDGEGGFDLYELRNRNIAFNIHNRPNLHYPFWVNPNKHDENGLYEVSLEENDGWVEVYPQESQGVKTVWRWGKDKAKANLNNIVFGKVASSDTGFQIVKKYRETTFTYNSVWNDKATKSDIGTLEVKKLFGGKKYFDFPKPTPLIKRLLTIGSNKDSVVIDFFSGSATTADAVMQFNAEDGGNRKWIMVQLPEETDEKSEAFKAGYKTIPDVARERIRRAGDKISIEHPDANVDYGFRALRIDDTNYKEVYKPAGELQQSALLDVVDNIKEDRSELDLLFGVLTASALELNRPLEERDIAGATVYLYDYFAEVSGLIACFAESISEEAIKQIAALKPLTAVFRDSTFPDSQAKVNLAEHFRIISPETKVKVI